MFFDDRRDAGRRVAERWEGLRDDDVVVVALPQGGVPVAYEMARGLDAPLDVIVVRKLGVPYQPELAFGALGEDGVRVINDRVVAETRARRDGEGGAPRTQGALAADRTAAARTPARTPVGQDRDRHR